MKKINLFGMLCIVSILIAGCGTTPEIQPENTWANVQIANPASENCITDKQEFVNLMMEVLVKNGHSIVENVQQEQLKIIKNN